MAAYLPFLAAIIASGAAAGVISGLLGVGGGIILVPVFHAMFLALGYHPEQLMQICVATSTGTIIFTSLRSVQAHAKRGSVDFGLIRVWGPAIAAGSVLGVFAATGLRSRELQLVFGVIGLCLGLYMAFGKSGWRLSDHQPGALLGRCYGLVIGFLSALMGIGGGSFTVPLLSAHNVPTHKAVGTSPGFGLLISIPGFLTFLATGWSIDGKPPYTAGYVNLPVVCLVVATTMLTVPLGVKLAHALSPRQLKTVFALTILLLAGNMLRGALMA